MDLVRKFLYNFLTHLMGKGILLETLPLESLKISLHMSLDFLK
jgi:hypothetical protein